MSYTSLDTIKHHARLHARLAARELERALKPAIWFTRRCVKPDRNEFLRVSARVGLVSLALGSVAFFVKLVFVIFRSIIWN